MAKVIRIVVHKDQNFATPKETVSQEEIETVLNPYYSFIQSLPGLINETQRSGLEGKMWVKILEFDTLENAQNAADILYGDRPSPEVTAFNALVRDDEYKDQLSRELTSVQVIE